MPTWKLNILKSELTDQSLSKPDLHQYIDRKTTEVKTEQLTGDRMIRFMYSTIRENASFVFNRLVSARSSAVLGYLNYDSPVKNMFPRPLRLLRTLGVNPDEIYGRIDDLDTLRKVFERQIQYWTFRPMNPDESCVVSPADARMLAGSFHDRTSLFIKEKFFSYHELIGKDRSRWSEVFENGDYTVFRLTPEKYHYNHAPVSGTVLDIYEINGSFHSCNPGAVVRSVTPFSKNRRVVTVIDTDVENGTHVGKVAMIEIVALMIGRIVQCYSPKRYDNPVPVTKGIFIKKGQPKSLFRPGSSTTVLVFQKNRVHFSQDLLENMKRKDVNSRFTRGFEQPLAETELNVRETVGRGI